MGLRDDILADLIPAMNEDLADAVELFSIDRVTGGGLDADKKPIPKVTETFTGRGFFLSFNFQEQKVLEIKQGDVKYIIPSSETPKKPLLTDKITIKGQAMSIVTFVDYPAEVGYALQLRKYGA